MFVTQQVTIVTELPADTAIILALISYYYLKNGTVKTIFSIKFEQRCVAGTITEWLLARSVC